MHILVADDHALVRDGLKPFLLALSESVTIAEAETLPQALDRARERAPDLILLDLSMPGMQGVESAAAVKRDVPDARVVILSGDVERETVVAAVNCGASGYLPKTLHGETIMHALRLIMSGGTFYPSDVLARSPAAAASAFQPGGERPFRALTEREAEVLRLLAEGNSNKLIARRMDLTEITVKSHLRNIYRKLGVNNRAQAVAAVLQKSKA